MNEKKKKISMSKILVADNMCKINDQTLFIIIIILLYNL